MSNQVEHSQVALNTTKAVCRLRWCFGLLPALLISFLLACDSDTPLVSDAQRHETPAPTEIPIPTEISAPTEILSATKTSPPTPTKVPSPTETSPPTPTKTPSPTETPTTGSGGISPPKRPPSTQYLSELLNVVPAEFSNDTLVFSINDPVSNSAPGAFAKGRAMHPEIAANVVKLNELMGLDFSNYEQGIWSWKPGSDSRTFMAFQGPLEGQQTTEKLESLEFRTTSYLDTTYFELHEDFKLNVRHELRRSGLLFNRLAFLEDSILAAPATEIIENLIAVRQGDSRTLAASLPHSSLANAAGEGLVSGAFFTPKWIEETWNSVNPRPADRLDRYRSGAEAWGTLSGHSLALLGYRTRENADAIVVVLYYPESTNVEANSQELAARWSSYHYDPSGPLSNTEDIPLNQGCSPLSVHTIRNAEDSIIVGSCPIIEDENTDSGTSGPSLWLWLFDTRQLEFLAQDIADLK